MLSIYKLREKTCLQRADLKKRRRETKSADEISVAVNSLPKIILKSAAQTDAEVKAIDEGS